MKFLIGQLFIVFNFFLIAVNSARVSQLVLEFYKNCFDHKANSDWTDKENFTKTLKNDLHETFHLLSREQPRVQLNSEELIASFINSKPIVILIHGFMSHSNNTWVVEMQRAFLKKADVNVVIVDWSETANTFSYLTAATSIQHIAHNLAGLMEKLLANKLMKFDETNSLVSVHCVGHSLGSHVCGLTAKMMKKIKTIPAEWQIQRITGLDPAQPCFENSKIKFKLMKDDAPFVDVIHSNMYIQNNFGFGLPDPIGHMDFYPNGGHQQPGCNQKSMMETILFSFTGPILGGNSIYSDVQEAICSHGRAYLYFIESLAAENNPNEKIAVFPSSPWNRTLEDARRILTHKRCDPSINNHCVEMGIDSIRYRKHHSGAFFAVTAEYPPFNTVLCADKIKVYKLLDRMLAKEKDEV